MEERGVDGFTAARDKDLYWVRITLLQFSVAQPSGQVKQLLLLPVLLQQVAEVVELVYTGGQPAEAVQ